MDKKLIAILIVTAIAATSATAEVAVETVAVGNPGNAADPATGNLYGSVSYTYSIGKFEITAGQYTEFLNAVADTDTYSLYTTAMDPANWDYGCGILRTGTPGSYSYSVSPSWAYHPVNYVSWGGAARFANWLHNGQPTGPQDLSTTEDGFYFINGALGDVALANVLRKPDATLVVSTEDEWYKAAYHKNDGVTGNYWDFPTQSNATPDNGVADTGNSASYFDGVDYTVGYPYYTTSVGWFSLSDSPYGTFDQGGNVREWWETDHVAGFRGGSWYFWPDELQADWTGVLGRSARYSSIGFRLVLVADSTLFEADFDDDGDVDHHDLLRWQAGYGSGVLHSQGDANDDGLVNGADYLIWQRQFGSSIPLNATNTAAPEPSALVLLTGLALGLAAQRRRWQSEV